MAVDRIQIGKVSSGRPSMNKEVAEGRKFAQYGQSIRYSGIAKVLAKMPFARVALMAPMRID